ncbi:Protein of unknown function [Raineyella antarctica]|uniref:DUF3017 domain-containing protein n=1 Tax=Raineyella antarctica TaxID=1577474 RepID=A0A1G6H5Q5_9ACTN|nr:DUF3017 domain-containing protein [Raineyella antarctica]SDB89275.1 Protein of unknown function [Raineyella antarctica]
MRIGRRANRQDLPDRDSRAELRAASRAELLGTLGPDEVRVVPDPPALGTIPPAGVPWSGPERLRADPGLRLRWLAVVVAIMAAGVVVIGLGHWQVGACIVGGGMIVGAVIRAIVPSSQAGLLRVRNRPIDVTGMLVVGVGIIVMVISRL